MSFNSTIKIELIYSKGFPSLMVYIMKMYIIKMFFF